MDKLELFEQSLLAFISKIGVWVTPLIPAFFVQRAMATHLDAPAAWGWLAAAALEIVGIAAMKNLLRAYTWEQERKKTDPAAPMRWYIVAAMIYYVTAFLIVLGVEFVPQAARAIPAAFVVLGGTAGLVIALSDDQGRRQRLVREMSAERSAKRSVTGKRNVSDIPETVSEPDIDRLQAGRKAKQEAAEQKLLTVWQTSPHAPHSEIAAQVGRSRPWVTGKLGEWEEAGIISRNGKH